MKYLSFSICSFVLGFSCGLLATINDTVLIKRNWNEVTEQIGAALKDTLGLTETLGRIKELSLVYKDGLPERVSRVLDRILEVSAISPDECNDEYLSEIAVLRNENLADFLLIKPFLKSNWNKQFEMCKGLILKEMEFEMGNLSESRRQQVRELQEDVIDANNGVGLERKFLAVPISRGIFSFMRPRLQVSIKKIRDKQTGEVLFREEFNRIVLELCSDIENKINKTPSIFKLFVYYDELKQLDKTTIDWIDYRETCDQILLDREHFVKQVYEQFKIEYGSAVKKDKPLAGWFRCLNCKTSQ